MGNLVRTARGRLVDMNQMYMDNQKAVAVGNGKMNARGDLLEHGKVVKTVEERREEYEQMTAKTTVTIPVSSESPKVKETIEEESKKLSMESMKAPKSTKKEPVSEKTTESEVSGMSLGEILNQ